MSFGINLRGDLAKLSDADLASQLEQAWRDYEAATSKPGWPVFWHSHRGPIRHPAAYRLQYQAGFMAALILGIITSLGPSREWKSTWSMHRAFCEIHDVTEEIARRVNRKKK